MEKKYIFVKGVMKLNPNYQASGPQPSTPSAPERSETLAYVSTMEDVTAASEAHLKDKGTEMVLPDSTQSSMEIIQDEGFLQGFGTPQPLNGNDVLERLSQLFAQYEVPIGLINKLLPLQAFNLHFIIDDSGSMLSASDLSLHQAADFILDRRRRLGKTPYDKDDKMSRWEEAENSLHTFIDILSCIPTQPIKIVFLNTTQELNLNRQGLSPEAFAAEAHQIIVKRFDTRPNGSTPMARVLRDACARENTAIYLLTDGVPNEPIPQIIDIMKRRRDPASTPLTLISCTDVDKDVAWLKTVEEELPFCAELDDYESEKREVCHDQGPGLPYPPGLRRVQQLVAALNPDDLDALDEGVPITKKTLDDVYGRCHTIEEYQQYFFCHPKYNQFRHLYPQFQSETLVAREILSNRNQSSMTPGYAQYQGGQPGFNPNAMAPPSYQQSLPMATLVQPAGQAFNNTYQPNPGNYPASSSSQIMSKAKKFFK